MSGEFCSCLVSLKEVDKKLREPWEVLCQELQAWRKFTIIYYVTAPRRLGEDPVKTY